MKCAECIAAGQVSRIHEGVEQTVPGDISKYWDEAGAPHIHSTGKIVRTFACSQGHTWEHVGMKPCPTCWKQVDP